MASAFIRKLTENCQKKCRIFIGKLTEKCPKMARIFIGKSTPNYMPGTKSRPAIPVDEVKAYFPGEWDKWCTQPDWREHGGESWVGFMRRSRTALLRVFRRALYRCRRSTLRPWHLIWRFEMRVEFLVLLFSCQNFRPKIDPEKTARKWPEFS